MRAYSIHTDHLTVVRITRPRRRRKCHCGCGRRATHYLAADGCNMGEGCEWSVWRRLRMLRPRGEAKFWIAPKCEAQEELAAKITEWSHVWKDALRVREMLDDRPTPEQR